MTHHGIFGLYWGMKIGPPYPLDTSDHSESEKKAGWKKSLSSEKETTTKITKQERRSKISEVAGDMYMQHLVRNLGQDAVDALRKNGTGFVIDGDTARAYKKAASYVVDKNMSYEEAISKTNKQTRQKAIAMIAACSGLTVASMLIHQ